MLLTSELQIAFTRAMRNSVPNYMEVVMVKITNGNCGDKKSKMMNSRRRYKLKRAMAHRKEKDEERAATEDEAGGALAFKVEQATNLPPLPKDIAEEPQEKKDAFYKVVNHAHQRRPNKKW